ncbi:hypothetical protein [Leisingera sp.]|uniref:hypothetical protein n=1 Tax=Leisingera sp. TaxID=1879318 RepID=UPI002B27A628|nr:hypothetical protein [Leisingera sp.]
MTCIVGIADGRNVWMGGDAAGSSGHRIDVRSHPKVFRLRKHGQDDILIGYTSSFRMGQALQYGWDFPDLPSPRADLMQWMCTDFIDSVRERLGAAGFKKTDNGEERGGMFMVGLRGRLFTIDSDFQVGEVVDGYNAIGCGDDLARGSLFSTGHGGGEFKPTERVECALAAATHWSAWVRPPFTVEILKGE